MQRALSVLLGPVFAKEMVEISRRRRYFLNRVLYGAALLAALVFGWYEARGWRAYSGSNNSIQLAARIASELFTSLCVIQYVAVYLFVPMFVAGVVAMEREDKTLDLLFTTHLRDREIVLGKLFSRLTVVALLFLCAVPIFSLISLFGGIDPTAVWKSMAETLLAMIFTGSVAVYFSSVSNRQVAALIRTYWWLAVWLLVLPIATIMIIATRNVPPGDPLVYTIYVQLLINPIAPFLSTLSPGFSQECEDAFGPWYYPLSYVVPLLLSSILLWRAVSRLRGAPTMTDRFISSFALLRAIRQRLQSVSSWVASKRRRRAPLLLRTIPVRNPLWLRSRLATVYDRDGHLTRIQWTGVVLAMIILVAIWLNNRVSFKSDAAILVIAPIWIAVTFFLTVISASSLVSDRRHGFFDLLLTTDLEPREIIDGTLAAVWEHTRIAVLLSCSLTAFMVAANFVLWYDALASILAALCFGLFLTMLGVSCSLVAPTALASLSATIALPLLMCVGILILGELNGVGCLVLWIGSIVTLGVGIVWTRRSYSAASIACLFIGVQLVLASLAAFVTTWIVSYNHPYWFIAHTSPSVMTMINLEPRRTIGYRADVLTGLATVFYCTAMLTTFAWARWWTIRNFDKLIGRTLTAPDAAAPTMRGSKISPPHRPTP